MQRVLSFLALSVLPAWAQHSAEATAFSDAIKQFLPGPATAMPSPKKVELTFTPDAPRAADTSPNAHPEAYARFIGHLDTMLKENTYNFGPAMSEILNSTNDEFAAMSWMEKAAAEGNLVACQFVADRKFVQVPKNATQTPEIKEAFAMVSRAADGGYDPAKINVFMCMQAGIGTKKDEKAAEKYILEACRSGNMMPRARWLLLTQRLASWEDRNRPEVAAEIERGNVHVLHYLSTLAPTMQEKVSLLQKSAEMGHADSYFELSAISAPKDPKNSFILLKEAARQHNSNALYSLGSAMIEGNPENPVLKNAGIEHNDALGRQYIKLASMLNNISASFWLGSVTYHGRCGFAVDKERAYRHFDHGAILGNPTCGAAAGLMLLRGLGIPQDTRKGLYYLNVAANMGVPRAIILLAYAQHHGIGLPADSKSASKLLLEAAAVGHKHAYVYLAYITAKGGSNYPADPKLAERYVRMAALDMKEKAHEMYNTLMSEGWNPEP